MDVEQFIAEFMVEYVNVKVESAQDQGDSNVQSDYYGQMQAMDFVKGLMKKHLGYLSD